MRELFTYIKAHAVDFGISAAASDNIRLRLRAPWRSTLTGRAHYEVVVGNADVPCAIIRDALPLYGYRFPFEPAHFPKAAQQLLPPLHGRFTIEDQAYSWEAFIPGPSLFEEIAPNEKMTSKLLMACAGEVLSLQVAVATPMQNYTRTMLHTLLSAMSPSGKSLFYSWMNAAASTARWMNTKTPDGELPLPCSWGHGDMWGKDIFRHQGNFVLIDWEWAGEGMPVAADLVDFYVTGMEHLLHHDTCTAWDRLLQGDDGPLHGVRHMLCSFTQNSGFSQEQCFALHCYALIRQVGKVVAQEGIRAQGYLAKLSLVRRALEAHFSW